MRALLWLAFALVLVVCLCSAALRLSGAAVACAPAPACLAPQAAGAPAVGTGAAAGAQAEGPTVASAAAPANTGWQRTLRLTHRVTASLAGLVFLFIVAFGFARWSISERIAGLSLLALTLLLALVGRITPSLSAAVGLVNLLGGHLLLAALAWLLAARAGDLVRWVGAPLFVTVVLASATGSAVAAPGRGGWLTVHAALGVVVVAPLVAAAWRLRRAGMGGGTVAVVAITTALAAAIAAALGLVLLRPGGPWPVALVHSAAGGLVLAGCAALWRSSRR